MGKEIGLGLWLLYLFCSCESAGRTKCDPTTCRPDNQCTCMSTQPPGNLSIVEMPQFVMLSFDDAVNEQNMGFYRHLLAPGRRRGRASGCNMAATFFVSAGYTDYSFVHELHSVGSEIALHSITHVYNLTYWRTLDSTGWEAEFVAERRILRNYALIPEEDMVGARAPFLEVGSGGSHVMMHNNGFLYDSSVPVNLTQKPNKLSVYPYTLDYGFQTDCYIWPYPKGVYEGLWTVPLNNFYRTALDDSGSRIHSECAMADACYPQPTTASDTFDFLRSNFELHYNYNKAPFPVFIHETWLHHADRQRGFMTFIDWLLAKDDVYLVSIAEVVHFMRNPKPLGEYSQSRCSKATEFHRCPMIYSCRFPDAQIEEARLLRGCKQCPEEYPWLRKPVDRQVQRNNAFDHVHLKHRFYSAGSLLLFPFAFVCFLCYFLRQLLGQHSRKNLSASRTKVA
ncbi:chitin deacetylase 7-like [Haemaphysalis longicornis]